MICARLPVARVLAAGYLFAGTLAFAPSAGHAAGGKRAGVPKFAGAKEALVRKQVMKVLSAHGYELAKSREMEMALQNTGALLESDDQFRKVAKELALAVIVTADIGKRRAKIAIHDGRQGAVLGEASFPGTNPRKIAAEVRRSFWTKLGGEVERGKAPPGAKKPQKAVAEAPEDDVDLPGTADEAVASDENTRVTEGDDASDSPGSRSDNGDVSSRKKRERPDIETDDDVLREKATPGPSRPGRVPATLEFAASGGVVNRSYSYRQDISGLRPHTLPLGGDAAAQAAWYPLSAFTAGTMAQFGVEFSFAQAFGVQSGIAPGDPAFQQGATFGNFSREIDVALSGRLTFGVAGNQVWVSAGGGEHAFLFTGRSQYASTFDVPDVIYRYVRLGVGMRLELPADLSLSVSGGYRSVFNGGGDKFSGSNGLFPHATVEGVDGEIYLGYRITDAVEVRLRGEIRRYFSSMNSVAADTFKAGGAIDQYLSGGIGVAYLYGGSGRTP
jgi:hypothetical protein